ncbi:MAG: hypothetical protein KA409_12835 [Ferruginibacter sp.]|nr:hypothetical protein [Ferruginibacter sp.]
MKKYIVTILSSLIFTISCQKNYEVQGTVKGNLLNDNAYIVDSSAVNASGVNSLSINKAKTSYRPKIGDIILSGPSGINPYGLLRKVVNITDQPAEVVCQTVQSDLNEAFKQLSINQKYLDTFTSNATFLTGPSLTLNFNNNITLANGIKLNGVLKFNLPEINIQYEKKEGSLLPEKVLIKAELNTEGSTLEIQNPNNTNLELLSEKIIRDFSLPPITIRIPVVTPLGILVLPVIFTQNIAIKMFPIKITGKAKWVILPKFTAVLGAKFENEVWTNISSFTSDVSAMHLARGDFAPTLSVEATATLLKPVYEIRPYGLDIFKGFFEVPNDLTFKVQTASPNYSLKYKLKVAGGIKTKFWTDKESEFSISTNILDITILEGDFSPLVLISNPSNYPITQLISGTLCAGYTICDFKCSQSDWNATTGTPKYVDASGTSRDVNGALLQNIINTWGFNSTFCTNSGSGALIFYNTSIVNGEVRGKVKILGDFGTCSPPYQDMYFRSFNFKLIYSTLNANLQTTIAGTYAIVSNELQTSQ